MKATQLWLALSVVAAALVGACSTDPYSYEKVGQAKTSYFGPWYRIDVTIVVPEERSDEALEETLRRAAEELKTSYEADIVLVRAYGPQDEPSDFGWSLGKAIHGPNGHLLGEPDDPFLTVVELGPSRSVLARQQQEEWERTAQDMDTAPGSGSAAPHTGAGSGGPDDPGTDTQDR